MPKGQLLFVTYSGGLAYKATTFGNWLKDRAVESGVTANGANTHGLRKAGATRLANHGATEWEIAAYLAHEDTKLTSKYVKKANRSILGASGMVIPPFLMGFSRRIHAAVFSIMAGVMPPMPMLGRSLL